MQSCTIHHCVLFFITLTFTSVPTQATVTPISVKLHQAVKLPCNYKCAGQGRWTMLHDQDNVLAECDQTSCRTRDGYNMFYDEYQQGELSLTITTADYSKRGLYTCDCDGIDIRDVRLSIETLKSSVELNPGEVLLMDLPVPQPVAVIYKARDSPALYGEQICTVTHQLLQCKTKYTPRTSLTSTTLTLRDVNITDSGIYTIRDLKNEEDIHIYTLTLKEMQKSVNVLWILPVLILVMVVIITGIVCFIKITSKRVKKQQMEQQEQELERSLHQQQLEEERSLHQQQLEQECLLHQQQLEEECLLHQQQLELERSLHQELLKERADSLKYIEILEECVGSQMLFRETEAQAHTRQRRTHSEPELERIVYKEDVKLYIQEYRSLPRESKLIHLQRKSKRNALMSAGSSNSKTHVLLNENTLDESQQRALTDPDDPDVQAEEQISLLQQENAGTLNHHNIRHM